jgi:hypothetical protein
MTIVAGAGVAVWGGWPSVAWQVVQTRLGVLPGAWQSGQPPSAAWMAVTLAPPAWHEGATHEGAEASVCDPALAACAGVRSWQLTQSVEPLVMAATTRASAEEWHVAHDSLTPPTERR